MAEKFTHHFAHEHKGALSDFYELDTNKLGEGSYGSVFKAYQKHKLAEGQEPVGKLSKDKTCELGALRAVKSIDKKGSQKSDPGLKKLKAEVTLMREIDHPNIIRLYENFEDANRVYLVMEICDGGELFDRIADAGEGFNERKAATYMRQILGAIYYCHKNHIAHRDIKPENFLMQDKSENAAIKVIDFGLAFKFADAKPMTTKAGTPYYVAPQVLKGSYSHKCDIWSCGVIAYILLCGYPPFYGDRDEEILAAVKKGLPSNDSEVFPDEDWDGISKDAKDLIKIMLTMDELKRPEAKDLLENRWILGNAEKDAALSSKMGEKMKENLKKFNAARMLKKTAITVIATQLEDKDVEALRSAFKACDVNGDGTLDGSEMLAVLKKLQISDDEAKKTLDQLDSDGSGVIDYTEFIAAVMDKSQYTKREHLWMAFRAFDENQDGKISKEELQKFLAGDNGALISDAKLLQMISEVDKNGDGFIDFDEFAEFMRKD